MLMKYLALLLICLFGINVSYAQVTFKPVSATMTDSQGTYTSTNFETTGMMVTDYANSVKIFWGGSTVTLSPSGNGVYSTSATVRGMKISLTAYRSNGKSYQVITRHTQSNQSVSITFIPSSSSTSSSLGRTINVSSTTIETSVHSWYVTKLELGGSSTIVTKVCRPKTQNSWINNTGSEFIEDCATGRRYYLQSSSIAKSPQKTILTSKNPKIFYEYYPALPSSVKTVNISSGSSYYVRNLRIR